MYMGKVGIEVETHPASEAGVYCVGCHSAYVELMLGNGDQECALCGNIFKWEEE